VRESTIARNYAEALYVLGDRAGELERFGYLLDALAGSIASDAAIRVILESPRFPKPRKARLLRNALAPYAPEPFMRFLEAVVRRGRQGLIHAISQEYAGLVDIKLNRVHAGITLAREPDEALRDAVRTRLAEVLGKEVIPHFRHDPEILGGVVVRVGDRVMDGSVRRRMKRLRRQMLGG